MEVFTPVCTQKYEKQNKTKNLFFLKKRVNLGYFFAGYFCRNHFANKNKSYIFVFLGSLKKIEVYKNSFKLHSVRNLSGISIKWLPRAPLPSTPLSETNVFHAVATPLWSPPRSLFCRTTEPFWTTLSTFLPIGKTFSTCSRSRSP